ncbi:MAG: hypothetical protein ACLRZ9_08240 [Eubacterium sp.]
MDNAIIKVCDGEYTNDNAIEGTIESSKEDVYQQYLYQAQTIVADYNIPLDIIKEEHQNV